MDRRSAWVLGIVFGGLFLVLLAFLFLVQSTVRSGSPGFAAGSRTTGSGPLVGVVEVLGPIEDSKKAVEQLEAFGRRDDIRAVVVRVDSPGGAVGPSQEIYAAIERLSESKKVVASMGSTAASGGYYIAAAADQIYANPGTLTGSIGVIFQFANLEGVMNWAGIQMNTITAGGSKDIGSPFREMTQEDRALLETLLLDVHEQFIGDVAKGRGLTADEVRPYADGRIFTGRQAQEFKLVDALGGLQAAAKAALTLAEVEGEPRLEYPKKENPLLMELLGESPAASAGKLLRQGLEGAGAEGGVKFLAPGL